MRLLSLFKQPCSDELIRTTLFPSHSLLHVTFQVDELSLLWGKWQQSNLEANPAFIEIHSPRRLFEEVPLCASGHIKFNNAQQNALL